MMARHTVQERGMKIRNKRPYRPATAWRLAGLYWLLLLSLSSLAGTPQRVLDQPLATGQQLHSPSWWGLLLLCGSVTIWLYGVVWRGQTLRFGRRIRPLSQSLFGLCWGISLGMWMLTIINWAGFNPSGATTGRLLPFLLSFGLIATWQAFLQSYFWGVHVAPEHDTPASNRSKVWRCHVPHLLASLLFFFLQGNAILFIVFQIIALALMSIGSAMPAWWDTSPQRAATVRSGLFGLSRTHGWEGSTEDGTQASPAGASPR